MTHDVRRDVMIMNVLAEPREDPHQPSGAKRLRRLLLVLLGVSWDLVHGGHKYLNWSHK